jgi:hypothetical protein
VEEDTGKNIHDQHGDASLVDYNRCSVPLLEIVSEPDIRTPAEAGPICASCADPPVPRGVRRQHGGGQLAATPTSRCARAAAPRTAPRPK